MRPCSVISHPLECMKNKISVLLIVLVGLCLCSCDDGTGMVGIDMMPAHDNITTNDSIFYVHTNTFVADPDSIVANTNECYLGSMIDPVTGVCTTCDYLAQFYLTEGFALPARELMLKDEAGEVCCDSIDLTIYFDSYIGDSLSTMKLTVHELTPDNVLREDKTYATSIDPTEYLKAGGVSNSTTYAINDLTSNLSTSNYYRSFNVRLPKEYGARMLKTYYEHPEYYENSYQFIRNVCPGFYFEHAGGTGAMVKTYVSAMHLYFSYNVTPDSVATGMKRMASTGEVIQSTRAVNSSLDKLSSRGDCTYLRSPSGLFTEVTLPIDSIVKGELYTDSINNARISFRRYNDDVYSRYNLAVPANVLLVTKSQMYSIFKEGRNFDNSTSFLGTFNPAANSYTFSDISALVLWMKSERDRGAGVTVDDSEDVRLEKWKLWEVDHPDWNKAMLIPVSPVSSTNSSSTGSSTTTIYAIHNQFGLSSVCLEGGADYAEGEGPVQLSVIYSHYSNK